jgi:aminoglycoside phosphotransferase (APT) family kinase protein
MSASLSGFELSQVRERLQHFLAGQGLEGVEIADLRRFTVGFSWITFGFTGAWREAGARVARRLILRIGPPIGIFAPYRASPEFRTLRALTGSGVPVPGVHWFSDEDEAFGAPFFICDFVAGDAPIPWTHDGGPAFDEATRRTLAEQFVSALAALHRFEWRGSAVEGIDGSTNVRSTALAQIEHWETNFARWRRAREPMLEWAAIWLREHAPVSPRISVVHGDFRIGNFLVDAGRITAILDWELVRLGDPVEDVGYICMQAWRGRSPYMCHLFERDELLERYQALTGLAVDDRAVRYWEAFGTYKLAVMHYGAQFCFETRGYNDMRMAGMSAQIPRMLLQVETAMERAK